MYHTFERCKILAIFHYTRMFGRSSQSFVRNATRETEAIYALPQIFDMTMFVCVGVGMCGCVWCHYDYSYAAFAAIIRHVISCVSLTKIMTMRICQKYLYFSERFIYMHVRVYMSKCIHVVTQLVARWWRRLNSSLSSSLASWANWNVEIYVLAWSFVLPEQLRKYYMK